MLEIMNVNKFKKESNSNNVLLGTALDQAAHSMLIVDHEGRLSQVNSTWEKMFGYESGEAGTTTLRDLTHTNFHEIFEEKLQLVVNGDLDPFQLEVQFIRKDGSIFWGDLSVTPVHGLAPKGEAVLVIIGDISDRKRMEEALQENVARYRATLDNLAQAVTLTDDTGKFTHVNDAFEPMFGYTPEEAKNLTHLDVTHPDDLELSREKLQAVIRGELDFYRLEKRYVRKDGSIFWADLTCTPVVSLDRSVAAAVAVIIDITQQKTLQGELQKARDMLEIRVTERTEELATANKKLLRQMEELSKVQEALRLSEGRLRAIFETARDCIFIKDRNLKYSMVNPAMETLLGSSAADIIQLGDVDLFGSGVAHYLNELDQRVLAGEVIESEHTRPVKGAQFTFLDVRAPMRNERGQIIGVCGISRNITERSRACVTKVTEEQFISTAMRSTLADARMAARTDIIVLLTGESGAGKDHLASFIHENSVRSSGPFYSVNCAAIPPEIAESELFGHEPGAFTGANRKKRGLLELAEGGTLLLNEIGELPLHMQAKLLTFLDSRSFTRVGGEKPVVVSARLIAATNRNLEEDVAKNRFRMDLFYRLNVLSIKAPPLRDRIEDLPILARTICAQLERELQVPYSTCISDENMRMLSSHNWPGNIRELRNVLERALIVRTGPELRFDSSQIPASNPLHTQTNPIPHAKLSYAQEVSDFKRQLILDALNRCKGSKQEACRLLGMTRHMLRRQIESLRMNEPK